MQYYETSKTSTFWRLFKRSAGVPQNVTSGHVAPGFLTHDFRRHSHNDFDMFDGRHETFVGFYGTSGVGKTRTMFEIFASSYGLYFVSSDAHTLNPGSSDLESLCSNAKRFLDESSPREMVIVWTR